MVSVLTIVLSFDFRSSYSQKTLSLDDRSYEWQIKTVQLYPNLGGPRDYLQPAVVPLERQNLVLEFDDIQDHRNNYYVKLIHCNFDWSKSQLSDLDFFDSFNENPINEYAFSNNTHARYIHYRFVVPPVKLPGNYVLIVYRDGEQSDLILSRRMMVFANQVAINKDTQFAGTGTLQRDKQVFNFDVDYSAMQIINPADNVHVVMRQNFRWDNAKINVAPNYVNEASSRLEYRFLDAANQFDGGNEFRWADFRSLQAPGANTARINRLVKPYELYLATDAPRSDQFYAQYPDLNGMYVIENLDVGEGVLTGDYVYTNFTLKMPQTADLVYMVGAFNNYQRNEDNLMHYNAGGYYESRQFIKQGLYNYQYVVDSKKGANGLEGNHFETENVYEVLVYQRPFRPNADLLVGYYLIPLNGR
ncbi:MAG: type IX secretion system plug protein domain-containing protein [Bacteroidota bacterium]